MFSFSADPRFLRLRVCVSGSLTLSTHNARYQRQSVRVSPHYRFPVVFVPDYRYTLSQVSHQLRLYNHRHCQISVSTALPYRAVRTRVIGSAPMEARTGSDFLRDRPCQALVFPKSLLPRTSRSRTELKEEQTSSAADRHGALRIKPGMGGPVVLARDSRVYSLKRFP